MKPLLRDGDFVCVAPLMTSLEMRLRTGMLVLFARQEQLIVHRIVGRQDGLLLERGDRLSEATPLSPDDVLGVVVARKRDSLVRPLTIPLLWRLRAQFEHGGHR